MDFTQQRSAEPGWRLQFPLLPRLHIAQVDFRRELDNKLVSAITRLWIEPRIPDAQARGPVFLQVYPHERFTLQELTLREEGLECTLLGYTNTSKVGEDAPRHNVLPSWLSYLVEQQVIQTLLKLFGKG